MGTNDQTSPQRLINRLASLGVLLVLVIVTVSATIRLSGAGLGCAAWPDCYGRIGSGLQQTGSPSDRAAPPMNGARLTHRITTTAAGVLILALAFICMSQRPVPRRETAIALTLLGLAVGLAVLGRWTPDARLPAVALGNLLGGLTMLALFWWLHSLTNPAASIRLPHAGKLKPWARIGLLLLVAQIVLGGLVSAKFAALSCTTLPDCQGTWWPGQWSSSSFNPFLEYAVGPTGTIAATPAAASLHMAHRYGAVLVACYLVWLGLRAVRLDRLNRDYRRLGWTVLVLVVAQVSLGMTAVGMSLPLWVVIAHNATAALLLLALISLNVALSPARRLFSA